MYHFTFEIDFKTDALKDLYPTKAIFTKSSALALPNIFCTRSYYTLIYVADGELVYRSNNSEHSVSDGQCFLIPPGTQTSIRLGKKTMFEYLQIEFSGNLKGKFASIFTSPISDIPKAIFGEIIVTCNNFQQNENLHLFLSGQLLRLYFELSIKQTNYSSFVKKAKDYLDENYMEDITIESISKMLNMDRHYLSRVFKNEIGLSMKAYQIKIRLEKAAEFLKENYPVSEVVQMVGYSDLSNFSHKFKELFGVSPKDYGQKKNAVPITPQKKETQHSIDDYNWSPKNWRNQSSVS